MAAARAQREQAAYEGRSTFRCGLDLAGLFERRIAFPKTNREQVGGAKNRRERVVEIMRDAAHRVAHGCVADAGASRSAVPARSSASTLAFFMIVGTYLSIGATQVWRIGERIAA